MKGNELKLRRIERALNMASNDFISASENPIHLWLDWFDNDYKNGRNATVCASPHPPADIDIAEDNGELLVVPLNTLITNGVLQLLSDLLTRDGKLELNEDEQKEYDHTIDTIANELERTIKMIRDLKI